MRILWLLSGCAWWIAFSSPGFAAAVFLQDPEPINEFDLYWKGLFWRSGRGVCGGEFPSPARIGVKGVLGGAPAIPYAGCPPVASVARDDLYIYYTQTDGIYRKAISALLNLPGQRIAQLPAGATALGALTLWEGRVFWSDHDGTRFHVYSMNPDGTDLRPVTGFTGAKLKKLVVRRRSLGTFDSIPSLFMLTDNANNGVLIRFDFDPPETLGNNLAFGVQDFALRDESIRQPFPQLPLRVTTAYVVRNQKELLSINVDTFSSSTLYTAQGDNQLATVAVDERNLYLIEQPVPCNPFCIPNGHLVQRQFRPSNDLNNSRPWDLIDLAISGSDARFNLRSDGQQLFWIQANRIMTLPTDAPRLELDFRAVGLEAVQTVQDLNNSVRLVANKQTFVRGYAALALNTTGVGPFFPSATLRGNWNGQDLGTITPINNTRVDGTSDLPTLRQNLNRSFLFELPPNWVRHGRLTLELEVNGNLALPETVPSPLANNRASTPAIEIVSKGSPCLVFLPMHAHAPNYWPWDDPAFGSIIDRAKAVLPVENFQLHFRTDRISLPVFSPKIEIKCIPFPPFCGPVITRILEYNPFEFPGDENAALNYLGLYYTFESNPAGCGDTHFVGTVHPSINGFNGIGYTPGHNLIVRMANASFTSPVGGMSLAHELSHNYDLQHIVSLTTCFGPCGNFPDGPYDFYPGDHCTLGETDENNPAALFGFDPLTRQVIRPNGAADFMTYECSVWSSRYNWDRLIGNIPGFQAARAGQFTAASIGNNDPVLLVQGVIDLPRNTAELWPFYQLPAGTFDLAKISASFAAGQQANTDYFIRLLDDSGAQLSQSPLAVEMAADGDSTKIPFTHFVPFDSRTRRIQLVRQGVVIAESLVSANAPVVTLGTPALNVGAQTLNWNWTATDADGDPLIFTIQYSPDNGASWQTLQVGYPALSVTLNTRMLPGSTQARLRVIASDGVNSTVGTSAPFVLPRHAPEVVINGVREGERLPFGTFGSLRGMGIDSEDGSLPGSALRWNLAGPVSRTNTGETLSLIDLEPGIYAATLAATDSDNQTNQTIRHFQIQPVSIPEAASAPIVDGQAADAAYANAAFIRFPLAPGRFATARLVHSGTDLYVCFSDLDYSLGEVPAVGVRIDANASRNPTAQPDDYGFLVNLDGIAFQEVGNGTSMDVTQSPRLGFAATVVGGQNAWSAELRIADSLLGGWNHAAGIMFAFKPHTSLPEETPWPLQSTAHQPVTWAPAYFGTPPPPTNALPVANAGPDRVYNFADVETIYLDGSASFDPDGSALSYSWTQVVGPSVTLSNSASAAPSFVYSNPPTAVTFRFRLVVNDGTVSSAPDEVLITVQPTTAQVVVGSATTVGSDGSATAELIWPGHGGDRVIVQASSNLVQWVNVASNTVDWVRRVLYRDIQARLYPYRFYRLVNAPATPDCAPAPDNLVAWWRAEDDALDATGNNSGTLLKGLSFATGKVGRALNFTSANQELLAPASATLDVGPAPGMTIEGWINPADAVSQYPIAEWNSGTDWGAHLWINVEFAGLGGPGCLWVNLRDTSFNSHYFASPTGLIRASVWQHVALTYDRPSGVSKIFLNGAQVASANLGSFTPLTSYDLHLGYRPTPGPVTYRGLLDEFALYNRALTSNELQSIYRAGVAGKCAPICGSAASALVQNFEVGNPVNYALSQLNPAPGPVIQNANAGSTGRFLRLINDGVNSQANAVSFTQIAPGTFPSVRAEFDFRLASGDAPADGFACMLIPTATYGTNGPGFVTPIAFEEPNIPGVFAVGFDVYPRTEPRNDVSVHWNGVEYANVTMADANVNLTSGNFHRALVKLDHVNGGALVSVTLVRDVNGTATAAYIPIRDLFIPGLNPFSSRVEFAGRTGALDMNVDLDNVRVQFLPTCLTAP